MKETQENLNPKRKIKNLQRNKKTKGITLIALVVTIIILLILSGVTINMLLGEEGIIKIAQESKNTWETTVTKEQEGLKNLMNELNSIMSDNDETGESDKPEKPNEGPNGKPLVDTITEIQTESNIEAEDRYGNPVIVPKGFKVIVDETTKNATTVPEGIVIEDIKGNQFVWIPTGTYKINESGITKTNDLTRRQWGTTANVEQEPTPITGDEVAAGYNGEVYYGERAKQDKMGNPITPVNTNIEAFLVSAKPVSEGGNGGFYIGRYEQGEGNVCKEGIASVSVTRDTAKEQAEAMYTDKEQYGVTSQLISSYAWDTALNFICQNSEYGYMLATTNDKKYGNIGTGSSGKTLTGGYPTDCYSNIYDFIGNSREWTTEYCTFTNISNDYPCVRRGAFYNNSNDYASYRLSTTADSYTDISFRLSLYI